MQSSGEERTFESGAVRDGGKKPMLQLISPHAHMRLGEWLRFACQDRQPKPYPPRNWEKGMPFSETIGALERHIQKLKLGMRDEDHVAAMLFGAMVLAHQQEEIKAGRMDPALDDMPHYEDQPRPWPRILPPANKPGPPITERMCPKCDAHLRQEQYETGLEFFCVYCEWNSLDPEPYHGDEPDNWRNADPTDQEYMEYARNLFDAMKFLAPDHVKLDVLRAACDCPDCPVHRSIVIEPATFYVCGPMRGLPFLNFPAFDGARKFGESLGYNIISPADMDRMYGIDPIKDPASPKRIRDATPDFVKSVVRRDVEIILRLNKERGDGLALLPGWQKSVGGMAEVRLAYWLGLKFVDARDWAPIDMDAELEMQV